MNNSEIIVKFLKLGIKINLNKGELDVKAPKGILTKELVDEIRANKLGLVAFLEREEKRSDSFSIVKAPKKDFYNLSSAQKRIFFSQQLDLKSTVYNMNEVLTIPEDIAPHQIESIFKKLVYRHESFRTSFINLDNNPVQRIIEDVDFTMQEKHVGKDEVANLKQNYTYPFDLSKAPLIRVTLIYVEGEKRLLLIDIHHIISDGFSQDLLTREFFQLFQGEKLDSINLQYKDYSEWQNSKEFKEISKKKEAFWLNRFSDEIPIVNLPIDHKRPLRFEFEGARMNFFLTTEETDKIKKIAGDHNMTIYMVILALFNILISKITRQEDIIVGTPVAARNHKDLEKIVGMFVNVLAIRNFPAMSKTIKEFFGEVKDNCLKAFNNQEYQFEDLVEKLSLNRDAERNPIFDITYDLVDQTQTIDKEIEIQDELIHVKCNAKFDLTLTGVNYGDKIMLNFEYSTKLFEPNTINQFVLYLKTIIHNIPEDNSTQLSNIDILTEIEKKKLLEEANSFKSNFPEKSTIQELFEQTVELYTDRVGCAHGDNSMTFKELNERSNSLARELRAKGIKPNTVVGLIVNRSFEMIIGILGIIKAGGAYLPIEDELPIERIKYMLKDSGVSIVLVDNKSLKKIAFSELQEIDQFETEPYLTPVRNSISNLDRLPIPDRSLIDYEKYNRFIGVAMVKNSISFVATRGCPYSCLYCHKIWPKKHFRRSPENLFYELKLYYDMGVKRFVIIDDIFNFNKKESSEFFNLIIKHDLKIELFFPNGLRGDILTKEYIDLMVKAGTRGLALALETASPRLQKLIGKNLNIDKLKENIEYFCEKYPEVILDLFTMIGFPSETEEEAMLTLDFIKSIKWLHFPLVSILKIYPNTEMMDLALMHGVSFKSITESTNLTYHDVPETLPFEKSFTLKYQADFFSNYFLLKERLLNVLPTQMKFFSEDELVQKYNSYLPFDIKCFDDFLNYAGITMEELGNSSFLNENSGSISNFNQKLENYSTKNKPDKDALKILLIDLSQFYSDESDQFYDVVKPPIGLMYLLTTLNERYGSKINGKILNSWIDFDSDNELKSLLKEFKPDIIGIRTLTFYKDFFHRTATLIRNWGFDVPIIAGGPYATSDYKTILKDKNIDLVVLGEGEDTLVELVKEFLENDKMLPSIDVLKNIAGLAFPDYNKLENQKKAREIIILDELNSKKDNESNKNLDIINTSTDLAYIIYTSGSTGKPKGTMIAHNNVTRVVKNTNYIELNENDKILQLSNYAFDGSVFDIYGALLNGSDLILIDKDDVMSVNKLSSLISKEQISVFFITTVLFNVLVESGLGCLKDVRKILFGGERISVKQTAKALEYLGNDRIIHVYGPTESTVYASYYDINTINEKRDTIPIGKPISNTILYVVDDYQNMVPKGIPGEILIGDKGLSRGYLNNVDFTNEKFIQNPFKKDDLLYKTGDIGLMLPDGNVEFVGRKDFQLKIRGFRIEIGDIESIIQRHKNIVKNIVTVYKENDDMLLCAYYEVNEDLDKEELKTYLLNYLPNYMIPTFFIRMDALPINTSGKIDRRVLPIPKIKANKSFEQASNEIEKILVKIWSEVLKIDEIKISINDNFFELGGHSLRATILLSEIQKLIKNEITLSEIFKYQTIKEFASSITGINETVERKKRRIII